MQKLKTLPDVSRETLEKVNGFAAQFSQWAQTINLVAPSTMGDAWNRHIEDSAWIYRLKPEAKTFVDLGSGGGFPGMVLAVLHEGKGQVTLVESNQKKAAFLNNARIRWAPSAKVRAERLEQVIESMDRPDVVTARALASLDQLLDWTAPWLEAGSVALFHKGRGYEEELQKSRAKFDFDLVEHKSPVTADSVVLEISALKRLV